MNRYSYNRIGVLLAVTALTLSGNIARADESTAAQLDPTNTVIVLAKATQVSNKVTNKVSVNPELANALQGILADNRLELELRLAGNSSKFLAADL